MEVTPDLVETIVDRVVHQIQGRKTNSTPVTISKSSAVQWHPSKSESFREKRGLFLTVDEAVEGAKRAHEEWKKVEKSRKRAILEGLRGVLLEHCQELSEMAVRETGLGRVEDKIKKNSLVITKTPGLEVLEPPAATGEHGLMFCEYAPYGVIASITPTTNPSETIINNGIGMLAAGNSVVFNAHPSAKGVSNRTIEIINRAVHRLGGPQIVVTSIENPSIESAQALMSHKGVALVVVTGGPLVVKAAMATGKKVIAAGPGNPPVVVDDTARIDHAAQCIVAGASLDNNIVCIVEKECIVLKSVSEALRQSLQRHGAYHLNERQTALLKDLVIMADGYVNKKFVGKDASLILSQIGVSAGPNVRLITCTVAEQHPFVQKELLMPVLPIVEVETFDEAIHMAKRVEHGFRHTAVIHSNDISRIHRMGQMMNCSIFVSNAPSFAGLGLGGEGYTSFTIASPTGEGLTTARHFARERRITIAGHLNMV